MLHHYYFVGTSLPSLQFGIVPDIDFEEFDRLLKENLTKDDYEQSLIYRHYHDILNIRAFLKGEELDPYGTLDFNTLEEAITERDGLPSYILHYLNTYESKEDRLHHFPELIAEYYRRAIDEAKGFLKNYLIFERELRFVMVGFRAKQMGRDVALELQYEDPEDEVPAQILAQKDTKTYVPPPKYEDMREIFEQNYHSPMSLYQAITEYKFNKIDEMIGLDVFSLDKIIGYMIQLILVESALKLDKKKGLEIVDKIVKESS